MVGRGGMNYLIKRYPISIALPSQLPAPLITIAFGILLFGNRIDTVFVIGGIMTLTGVLLVMLPERRRAAL
jgi:O-acetylserine/cysteine efflux transporter